MSSYFSIENRAGVGFNGSGFAEVSSTQGPYPLGTIIRAKDSATTALGMGEFIYLLCTSATVVGSLVTYDQAQGLAAPASTTTERSGRPVAVAMAAAAAGQYFWGQIDGVAVVAKGVVDFPTASPIYRSGTTAGYITVTAASGNQIEGAVTANAASVSSTTSTILVQINRPSLQGQGT
jgi:hypothetical protein